ncbi:chitin synthase activator (Chs3) [Aspergillus bombycis]|uniref:Chitin synthase activator (Chs3) n=1 Tax=Aspergillus bombycis TaxID=109264 RepID=A0A1F8AG33_9EURO|nr:chitin synthase activator (Chs3) [Aspergillus bombycis]OGM50704.1 chitin synthase activator (Chs3) [Aspergillus bombycis]
MKMASPVTGEYPQPVSPPPVYLRSSPPPPPPHHEFTSPTISKRPLSMSISRKPPPAAPGNREPFAPSVRVDGDREQQVPNAAAENDYDIPPIPTSAFAHMSIEDRPHTHTRSSSAQFPPRRDSYAATHVGGAPIRHTPASSGSWSVVDAQIKDEPTNVAKTSDSSLDQGAPSGSRNASSRGSLDSVVHEPETYEPLHYHHRPYAPAAAAGSAENFVSTTGHLTVGKPRRPHSTYSFGSDLEGRNGSPHASPYLHARSSSSASPDVRPLSFVDLLNTPYPQPGPAPVQLGNAHLRLSVGNNASLLSHKQTFEMYLANVKKTDNPAIQYEFAVFMVNAMLDMPDDALEAGAAAVYGRKEPEITRSSLLKEAKSILQRLSDRSYPFAQYYLADGYASGLFSKGKEDYDRAFPLFIAASKHGHIEACYRTALCYEFGWGTRVEAAKAQQFYRQAASKNHPGAMMRMAKACLAGDMGLGKRYREGIKWMKRATESADSQYNSAPYELGLLHEEGYGDDVFPDPSYAAQLFTKSADLGHVEANYRLGDAYEHGKLSCPRDPALSIHFYTGAAQAGHPLAMMALCAWYLVGAEPVLEKDEGEAYEWAKRAAETGLAKAQYAVGYFTEMGIGCRRDILAANVWYVQAADQGDARATQRIAAIRAASDGVDPAQAAMNSRGQKGKKEGGKTKRFGIF